jgi:hypothetical protein
MANSKMDLIKSDPIEALTSASKISLQSGGVLLVFAGGLIYQSNEAGWHVSGALVYTLVIGAILMGVLSVALKVIDVLVRFRLAAQLLSVKGTTDPKAAKGQPVIDQVDSKLLNRLLDKSVSYVVMPGTLKPPAQTPEDGPPT